MAGRAISQFFIAVAVLVFSFVGTASAAVHERQSDDARRAVREAHLPLFVSEQRQTLVRLACRNCKGGGRRRRGGGGAGVAVGLGIMAITAIAASEQRKADERRRKKAAAKRRARAKARAKARARKRRAADRRRKPKKKKAVVRVKTPSGGGNSTPPRVATPPAGTPPTIVTTLPPTTDPYWPREVVVEIDRFLPATTDDEIARDYGVRRLSSDTNVLLGRRVVHYFVPDQRTADGVVAAMQGDNRVLSAQRNNRYELTQSYGNDSINNDLQYALTKIHLTPAHAIAQGRGVKIAVIDSGVDRSHPDLKTGIAAQFDAAPGTAGPVDSHGTAVAGIIRASGLAKGIAPESDVLAARAFYNVKGYKGPQSSTVVLLRAMDWAVANGAKVVNMSFAGAHDLALERVIGKMRDKKTLLVAAGGNNGPKAPPAYPAAYDGVIAVTATDPDDRLYDNANRGDYIELAAPGVDIFVVAPNSTHSFSSGTSMAAAHVSGLIALIVEQRPSVDEHAVREILTTTAVDLGAPGPDKEFGAGLVNAQALVKAGLKAVAKR